MNDDQNSYKVHEFVAHSTQVNCMTFGPLSTQVLATGGEDFKVNIWRLDNAANIWCLKQNKSPIECLCFDGEEQYVCSGAMNGSIKVFDLNEGKLARNLRGHQIHVTTVHYHPYGEFIVSGSFDNSMKVWDVRNKTCVQTYSGHDKEITCAKFSPDGRWVASSAKDGQVLVWDLIAGKLLHTIRVVNTHVTSFEFNPCEFLLAGACANRTAKFWDLEVIEEIGHTTADSTSVRAISFSDEGTRLCTANNDTLRVWSWDPVTLQQSTVIGWDKVHEMKVAPESDNLVAGAFNSNFVSLWSVDLAELSEQQASSVEEGEDRGLAQDLRAVERSREQLERLAAGGHRAPTASSKQARKDSAPPHIQEARMHVHDLSEEDEDQYVPTRADRDGGKDRAPSKVRSAFESPERPSAKESAAGTPGVQWEGGVDGNVLATSMGESFLKRMKAEEEAAQLAALEQRSVHDKLPASKYPPGRRPQTREREAAVASRRGERRAQAMANKKDGMEDLGMGLAVVGLGRPQTSLKQERVAVPTRDPPPQPPGKHVVNKQPAASRYAPLAAVVGGPAAGEEEGIDDGGGSGDRDRDRGGLFGGRAEPRRASSDHRPAVADALAADAALIRVASCEEDLMGQGAGAGNGGRSNGLTDDQKVENVLATLEGSGDEAVSVLSQRLTNLRLLRNYWERGEVLSIINHLHTILATTSKDSSNSQSVVVADFFNTVDLKSSLITLDMCGQLLPLLETMMDTGNITLVSAALTAVESLCVSFGDLIRQTRAIVVPGGVDISREERLQKCNVSFVTFARIRSKLDGVRHQHRKNLGLRDVVDRLQGFLNDLM